MILVLTAQPAAAQVPRPLQPDVPRDKADQLQKDFTVQLEPPGPDRIFRIESEAALRERIRQEFRNRNERADFPKEIELVRPGETLAAREFPPTASLYVPDAVCYKPLYFEDKNVERNGWDAGVFQPILSFGHFYKDLTCLPYNVGVMHPCACEFSSGYVYPGDPIPLYCYVPPFSVKGTLLEVGTILGGIWVFP